MNLQIEEHDVMMEMNITPLIDVMLVLLVMLIITIPIQLHSVVINMPTPTQPNQKIEPKIIKIEVDASGHIFWDGRSIPNDTELSNKFMNVSKIDNQPEIHIKPTKHTRYKFIAHIMANAQSHGVKKIGIIGGEQFVN